MINHISVVTLIATFVSIAAPCDVWAQNADQETQSNMRSRLKSKDTSQPARSLQLAPDSGFVEAQPVGSLTQPEVPAETKKGGVCTLVYDVTVDGLVENAEIARCADPAFGEALVAESANWRFKPATRDGVAVRRERKKTSLMYVYSSKLVRN